MIVLTDLQNAEVGLIQSVLEVGVDREGGPVVALGTCKEVVIGMTALFNRMVQGPALEQFEQQGFLLSPLD